MVDVDGVVEAMVELAVVELAVVELAVVELAVRVDAEVGCSIVVDVGTTTVGPAPLPPPEGTAVAAGGREVAEVHARRPVLDREVVLVVVVTLGCRHQEEGPVYRTPLIVAGSDRQGCTVVTAAPVEMTARVTALVIIIARRDRTRLG